jgi:hypothetical protein
MRHIFAAAIVIAASTAYAFAGGQSGKPRYFVKAWLQKTDKSFEHTTGWCDESYRCSNRRACDRAA